MSRYRKYIVRIRVYEIAIGKRRKRLNNGDTMERHYYFPLRMIYGQNRRDRIQRRRIDLIRSIVTLYKYANRLSLIKLVKAMLASQTSRSREYSLSSRGHLL
jgi:hypothetical protein